MGAGLQGSSSSLFQPSKDRKEGRGGVKLKICLSDCCLATILLQVISVGAGLGSSRGEVR